MTTYEIHYIALFTENPQFKLDEDEKIYTNYNDAKARLDYLMNVSGKLKFVYMIFPKVS
jgi:hypothetical protein